jgi:hypothetical protein
MSEDLKESKVKQVPYSQTPLTACPKGGRHRGLILDPCEKCKAQLLFRDFEIQESKTQYSGTIKCIDCGDMRTGVKPQDMWQVKRCKPCQAKKSGKSFKQFIKKVRKSNGKR